MAAGRYHNSDTAKRFPQLQVHVRFITILNVRQTVTQLTFWRDMHQHMHQHLKYQATVSWKHLALNLALRAPASIQTRLRQLALAHLDKSF
jgi:hypothetical protein